MSAARNTPDRPEDHYTPYRIVVAEGARIGIAACLLCGACIYVDPSDSDFDAYQAHNIWHREHDDA